MDIARDGGGFWSAYEEVGKVHHCFYDISYILVGLGQARVKKVKARDPFLTQPNQYTADVMKSMMYFDPPLHMLASIHLLPHPHLTYPIIQTG